MMGLIEYDVGEGRSVLVQVDEEEPGYVRATSVGQLAGRAATSLQDALEIIRPTAQAIIDKIESLARKPNQATVEFGLRLNGKAGAVIASTEAEGHFTVTLTWNQA